MIRAGTYHDLSIARMTSVGAYLDDGDRGVLLPKRFVPADARPGMTVRVFVYHDSEDRLVATTEEPKALVGEIARLKVVSVTHQGAFLDWGLAKDLFVPKSQQASFMRVGGEYLVRLYVDEQTGRVAATERIEGLLSNDPLTVREKEAVALQVYRRTDLGYAVVINGLHSGMLYYDEVFHDLEPGDRLEGFVRTIRPDGKVDVVAGKQGYERVEGEADKVLRLLREKGGYLPYHDKSTPGEIYEAFGMSKKTFKMALGALYRRHLIQLEPTGVRISHP